MGLPSRFLAQLPPEFVRLEFADLKTVAAEYHPEDHRMVFHVALSEGAQGRRFRPLREIGSQDLATIYHEAFHAYFDYVDFGTGSPKLPQEGARLYRQAQRFLTCRYTVVEIALGPPQRRGTRIERRRITEGEAWDALNETWGVFVGWAVWNMLEVTDRNIAGHRWDWDAIEGFLDRLEAVERNGELTGYFEPAAAADREVIPRWYLAPSNAISVPEMALLLEIILEESPGFARLSADWIPSAGGQGTGNQVSSTC